MDQEVRKSVVRISFNWMPRSKKDKKFMVIAGIILSIQDNGFAVIAANSTFFRERKKFAVSFPNATEYEEAQQLVADRNPKKFTKDVLGPYESVQGFYIFTAKPRENGYIKAARFDTQPVKAGDPVDSFVFPRDGFITPTGYCRGSVINVCTPTIYHDCDMHEYAYLGSPLFNSSGNLVGITYLDKGDLQSYTVWKLQEIFKHCEGIVFVSHGEEHEGAEAQVEVEEPTGAEAQVEE